MSDIEDWPSRKRWSEIEDSVKNSYFRENKKGETFADFRFKYKKQIEKETEIIFANSIINWLSDRVKLTKLSDDLVNAMADDTNLYCRYLEQYFTQSQKNVRKADSFKWSRGRRLFYIILDVISPGRNTLSQAIVVYNEKNKYQSEQKSIHFDEPMQTIYESKPKAKMIYFNPISLFKIRSHKRALSKWFRESKVFDIEGDDEKLTPSEYLQFCYDDMCIESDKKGLSHDELKNLKNQFTRKFRPWLVDSINAYWFDVMVVAETKKHHKTQHKGEPLQRKQPIKFYERYTLCLVIDAWFESETQASLYLDRNLILKAKFEELFPKSESHYFTANEHISRIDKIIKLDVNFKQEIKNESEVTSEEINLTQQQKNQAWTERFKQKFGDETGKQLISDLRILNNEYCDECQVIREYSNPLMNELTCPICGSLPEDESGNWWEKNYIGSHSKASPVKPNINGSPEGKIRMKDWEKKIWRHRRWAFRNSHIPEDSQKRIESVIASKIELIKRFKNPVTYE